MDVRGVFVYKLSKLRTNVNRKLLANQSQLVCHRSVALEDLAFAIGLLSGVVVDPWTSICGRPFVPYPHMFHVLRRMFPNQCYFSDVLSEFQRSIFNALHKICVVQCHLMSAVQVHVHVLIQYSMFDVHVLTQYSVFDVHVMFSMFSAQ